jgi:hypothetical protein
MSPMLRHSLACGLAALALAAPAAADTVGVTLGLTSGGLTARGPATVVDGTATISVRVADGRGNGRGWTLRLETGTGVTVTGITATCAPRSTCTLPTMVGAPSGTRVLRAAQNTGMGVIDLRVTVQSDARTTVTFAVS